MSCISTLLLIAMACAIPARAAFCSDNNSTGPPNTHPIDRSQPVFVRSNENGELFKLGNSSEDFVWVLHVWGNNGYDFGYAAGSLLPHEMNDTLTTAWAYFKEQVESAINNSGIAKKYNISEKLIPLIAELGLEIVLDLQFAESKKWIDPQVVAEMHGIADASGLDFDMVRRIHLIGEVTQGHCSYYGAWGDATAGGKTLQLRALDWDTGAGLQNHPVITVYHPLTPKLGYEFANVGWAGWIGTLTGMSANKLGMSEIGIAFPDPSFGNQSFIGIPFVFLMRQILQYAENLGAAKNMITNANRTCDLVLGIGDGAAGTATMVEYSKSVAIFFTDTNLEPNYPWHPRLQNTVYCGMDWLCPSYQWKLWHQLNYYHGTLTPEISIMNVTSWVKTGELHTAVYDLTDMKLYVANARGRDESGPLEAYRRQFVMLDLHNEFFRIKKGSSSKHAKKP